MASGTKTPASGEAPLVSIVIAVRNGARTLEACLASIAAQTYTRREVIVIDAASADGTADILRRNAPPVTYWESEPDRGIAHAWNKALARARGEWLLFLGADDRFASPEALAHLIAAAAPEYDLVAAKLRYVGPAGEPLGVYGKPFRWREFRKRMTVVHPGTLHNRRLFDEVGPFDERFRIVLDYELLLRKGAGLRAAFLDEITVLMGAGGVSTLNAVAMLRETARAQALRGALPPAQARAYAGYLVLRKRIKGLLRSAGLGRWLKP